MATYETICVKCQNCETCNVKGQGLCLKCQELSLSPAGTFSFHLENYESMCPNNGQFNKDIWLTAFNHLNKRMNLVGAEGVYEKVESLGELSPFTANEFNAIAGNLSSSLTVNKNTLIEGKYFINLENAINSFEVASIICENKCNTFCQACDNGGEAVIHTPCCSCDDGTCQSSCESECMANQGCSSCLVTCESSRDTYG